MSYGSRRRDGSTGALTPLAGCVPLPTMAAQMPRLSDGAEWHTTSAHCAGCHHTAEIDVAALVARFGDVEAVSICPMLRCTRCGYDGKNPLVGECSLIVTSRSCSTGRPA